MTLDAYVLREMYAIAGFILRRITWKIFLIDLLKTPFESMRAS
jgi:hypothetical protein